MNYYEILGVTPFVYHNELKKAYKKAVLKYHPDITHTRKTEEKFKLVLEAYHVLKNPVSRAQYDRELVSKHDKGYSVLSKTHAINLFKNFIYNIEFQFIKFKHDPEALKYEIDEILLNLDDALLEQKMKYSSNFHVQINAARALRYKKRGHSYQHLFSVFQTKNDDLIVQVLSLMTGLKFKLCFIHLLKSFPHVSIRIRNEIIKLFKNFDEDFIKYLLSTHVPRENPDYKSIAFEMGSWL